MVPELKLIQLKYKMLHYQIIKLNHTYFILYDGCHVRIIKKCVIGLPGGCPLGPRPIDQHIKELKLLGAEIDKITQHQ